jgi:sortase A
MTAKTKTRTNKQIVQDFFLTLGIVIFLIIGVGALVYPMVRNSFNDLLGDQIMARELSHQKSAQAIADQMAERKKIAREKALEDPYSEESLKELHYDPITLPIYVEHLIAEIYIPSIKQYLPVFDNSSEQFLDVGASWLPTSSLITGGVGSHSAVAGHSGIPSATLFNNVPKMKKGDLVIYKISGEYIAYKVFKITKVGANDRGAIVPELDKDLTTLVTCVPIGINTHRLLVTGERVPFTPTMLKAVKAIQASKKTEHLWLWLGLSLLVLLLLVWLIFAVKKLRKQLRQQKEDDAHLRG